MIQFYAPDLKETRRLGAEESGHCVRVLRKKAGDTIYATDGGGRRYECRITDANPRATEVEILREEEIPKEWDFRLTIAVAPTKNADRMAWLVEKCTEIGVDRIVFIKCRHSERKDVNTERLRRNAISAMNQSLKTRLPEIEGMTPLAEIAKAEGEKYFGYCDAESERKDFSREYGKRGGDVTIAIGPEGDFAPEEVRQLEESGYKAVTFGDERLRTETAAMYAAVAAHVVSGLREATRGG